MAVAIEKDGAVWTVVMHRPEARNAVDPEHATALYDAFLAFEQAETASVAVFWGAGGAFCAGYDLKRAAALPERSGPLARDIPDDPDAPMPPGPMGPSRLLLSKPVIAAIEGPAVAGGMELALWADVRVMAESAYMGVYCRRWGVPLIDGGTVRLPRIIGRGRALDLILTGRKIDAHECHTIGLCERLAPHGQARAVAEAMAHEIARFPQACVRADRRAVYLAEGADMHEGLRREWRNSSRIVAEEGIAGAGRFAAGKGRSGDFSKI